MPARPITEETKPKGVPSSISRFMKQAMVRDEEQLSRELDHRLSEMQDIRRPYESQWKEIAELVVPEYEFVINEWLNDSAYDGPKGSTKAIGESIYDSTALTSLKTLADGLMGYLVSRSSRWFHLIFQDQRYMEMPGVRQWIYEVEDILYHQLSRSNFYDELHPSIMIGGSMGTSTQFRQYDDARMQPHFSTRNPVECYVAANHMGEVDTVYRVFRMTRRQAEQMFDAELLSERILNDNSGTRSWPFLHAVFPRSDLDSKMGLNDRAVGSLMSIDQPYASIYKEISSGGSSGDSSGGRGNAQINKIISAGGFKENPYTVWRWMTEPMSVYGSSPSRKLLPLIRQLNQWSEMLLLAGEMNVTPPANVPISMGKRRQLYPRGVNFYHNHQEKAEFMRPMGQYPIGPEREARLAAMIREAYGTDTFLMLKQLAQDTSSPRTAYETAELVSERAAILGSTMGRLQNDQIEPNVAWLYQHERARGHLPDPPESLIEAGRPPIKLEMDGELARAQKLLRIRSVMTLIERQLPIWQLSPQTLDGLDFDALSRWINIEGGAPPNMVKTLDELAQMREERAFAAQQQQQMEQQQQQAQMIRAAGGAEEALGAAAGLAEAGLTGGV